MPESPTALKSGHWAVTLAGTYTFSLGIAFFWSYLPRHFVSVGWTSAAIGTALGVATLLRSFAMPAWARLAESRGAVGPVVRGLAGIGVLLLWTLPFVEAPLPVYASLILVYITWNAYLPLVDALTIRQLGNDKFGRVRAWGSAAYGAAALGVAAFGYDQAHAVVASWSVWAIAILGTIGLGFVWAFPRAEVQIRAPALPEAIRLLRRPALYTLLPLWALHWASQAPFNLFLVFLCEDRGMGGWVPGIAVFAGIAAEVVFLARGHGIVARLGPERLFALCAAVTVARWFLSASVETEALLIGVQIAHGLSFGGFLLSAMAALDREIRPEVRPSGQALLYVVVFGFGSAFGNSAAGWIEEHYGAASAFTAAGWLEVLVLLGAILAVARMNRR